MGSVTLFSPVQVPPLGRRVAAAARQIMLTKISLVKGFFVNMTVGLKAYPPVPMPPLGRRAASAASRNMLTKTVWVNLSGLKWSGLKL